ncbi:hypothetical protein F5X98DRAFT_120789 [Xylaria grammica]|nr:hypothetical protein F5X98DRAFT_120789 [Xylaria grammica]
MRVVHRLTRSTCARDEAYRNRLHLFLFPLHPSIPLSFAPKSRDIEPFETARRTRTTLDSLDILIIFGYYAYLRFLLTYVLTYQLPFEAFKTQRTAGPIVVVHPPSFYSHLVYLSVCSSSLPRALCLSRSLASSLLLRVLQRASNCPTTCATDSSPAYDPFRFTRRT